MDPAATRTTSTSPRRSGALDGPRRLDDPGEHQLELAALRSRRLTQGTRARTAPDGGGRGWAQPHGLGEPLRIRPAEGRQATAPTQQERGPEQRDLVEEPFAQEGAQHLGSALDHQAPDAAALQLAEHSPRAGGQPGPGPGSP